MAKHLHELLAVEPRKRKDAAAALKEVLATFGKRASLFTGLAKTYRSVVSGQTPLPDEHSSMDDTVPKRLRFALRRWGGFVDVRSGIEASNRSAKAVVVLPGGGKPFGDVAIGAGELLHLEHRLNELRPSLSAIPTLAPGRDWKWDEATDAWKARDVEKNHVQKEEEPLVAYPHQFDGSGASIPAQVKMVNRTITKGIWKQEEWSGCVTPADKSELLARLDDLLNSVTKARQRANTHKPPQARRSKEIVDYLVPEGWGKAS